MHLKASLHCHCGDKGALKLGAVDKHLHPSVGEQGKQGAKSSNQPALLKKLPKSSPIFIEVMKLL